MIIILYVVRYASRRSREKYYITYLLEVHSLSVYWCFHKQIPYRLLRRMYTLHQTVDQTPHELGAVLPTLSALVDMVYNNMIGNYTVSDIV